MSANVEAMVREGVNALKAGRKEEARTMLMKAVEVDQFHEEAWLWLSAVVETVEDQQTCLENVLAINPNNQRALQGIQFIEKQRGAAAAPSAPPAQSVPPPPAPAEKKASYETSVEWAAPADADPSVSPASARRVFELSDEDYDDWVSGLNLPATGGPPVPDPEPPAVLDLDDGFDEDDDPAADIPTTVAPPVRSRPEPPPARPQPAAPSRPLAEPAPKARQPAPPVRPVAEPEEEDELLFEEPELSEPVEPEPAPEPMFPEIPTEIRPTRLPGTNERLPIPMIVGLLVVIGLNVAAGFYLFQAVGPLLNALSSR